MSYKSLVLLIALTISNAFACPDLAGKYSCKVQNGEGQPNSTEIFQISQQEVNNVTTYSINNAEIVADGNVRTTTIPGLSNVEYNATCDESLMLLLKANVHNEEGRVIGWKQIYTVMYMIEDRLRFFDIGSNHTENNPGPVSREAICHPIE